MSKKLEPFPLGSVSAGTLRSDDLIPVFASILRDVSPRGSMPKEHYQNLLAYRAGKFDEVMKAEFVDELMEALSDAAPPYVYFGANAGDGSDFGFWVYEDWEQMAKDDETPFVPAGSNFDDNDNPLSNFVIETNDHGNVSLYRKVSRGSKGHEWREVWSVV